VREEETQVVVVGERDGEALSVGGVEGLALLGEAVGVLRPSG
jgi:hypothetical protein